jgi:hypothetical protein
VFLGQSVCANDGQLKFSGGRRHIFIRNYFRGLYLFQVITTIVPGFNFGADKLLWLSHVFVEYVDDLDYLYLSVEFCKRFGVGVIRKSLSCMYPGSISSRQATW